jgi:hypothetical protein
VLPEVQLPLLLLLPLPLLLVLVLEVAKQLSSLQQNMHHCQPPLPQSPVHLAKQQHRVALGGCATAGCAWQELGKLARGMLAPGGWASASILGRYCSIMILYT